MPEPDWITITEAATLSGYHPDYIRKLATTRRIKAQQWIREWQISRKSLLEYLDKMQVLGKRRGPKPQGQDGDTSTS